jgi:hypothetical protein
MIHEAKQFYIDYITGKPKSHRTIENVLMQKFSVSGVQIRNLLLEGEYIKVLKKDKGNGGKIFMRMAATGKVLPPPEKQGNQYCSTWDDGTPKSRGNAFDWRNYGSAILQDKAFMFAETMKKNAAGTGGDARKQFTIYSRARPSAQRGIGFQ